MADLVKIVNNLTTNSSVQALSAAQGKVLQDTKITGKNGAAVPTTSTISNGEYYFQYDAGNAGLINLIYPIGSIYISTVATNPGTIFGVGTWEQIQDTFLLAAGSSYTAGNTGGEATHTLTVNEMPSHTHLLVGWIFNGVADSGGARYGIGYQYNTGAHVGLDNPTPTGPLTWGINANGGDQAHNNMPPYLVVYMWKRTA